MRLKIYWINEMKLGRLGVMPRPRGGDWLEDEIRSLKMSGVNAVVSLLEEEENEELGIIEEQALCETNGISFFSFPIRDMNVPPSREACIDFARSLFALLQEGKSIVVHCRQGLGRSSLIAACVLVLGGLSVDEAFEKIGSARGYSVPETQEQRDWIIRLAETL